MYSRNAPSGRDTVATTMGEASEVAGVVAAEPDALPAPGALVCELCSASIAPGQEKLANGHRVCAACAAQLEAELALGQASADVVPRAAGFGALGALVGAAAWAAVVIITDYEIGYLAVLVGFLAGYGVKYGARGQHGRPLQHAALVCTVVGLIASKYFIYAHFLSQAAAAEGVSLGYLSGPTITSFPRALVSMLSPFDLLWLFLALSSAWRVPAAPRVNVA